MKAINREFTSIRELGYIAQYLIKWFQVMEMYYIVLKVTDYC